MKKILALTLTLNLIIPHSEVLAKASCEEAKNSLVALQAQEDKLTNENAKIDGQVRDLKSIKTQRNKFMARLMLLEGVEANIEQFNESLTKIKVDSDSPSLFDLLDNKDALDQLSVNPDTNEIKFTETIENHITSAQNLKTSYDLIKGFHPVKFAVFAKNAYLKFFGVNRFEDFDSMDAKAKATRAQAWKNGAGGKFFLDEFKRQCADPNSAIRQTAIENPCEKVLKHIGENESNSEIVAGYFGLMKYLDVKPETTDLGTSDNSHLNDFHTSINKYIEANIPTAVLNDEKYDENMRKLTQVSQTLSQSKDVMQNFIKAKAKCRLQGNAKCDAEQLKDYGIKDTDIAALSGLQQDYGKLTDYINKYRHTNADADSEISSVNSKRLEAIEAKLDSMEELLGIADESGSSKTAALLSSDQKNFTDVFDTEEAFKNFFNGNRKDCLHRLMGQVEEGKMDQEIFSHLKDLLKITGVDSCFQAADKSVSMDDSFKKNMLGCLMDLRGPLGQNKVADLRKTLSDEIDKMDQKIALLHDSEAFKALQELKAISINILQSGNCSEADQGKSFPAGCQIEGTKPYTTHMQILELNVNGVTQVIETEHVNSDGKTGSGMLYTTASNAAVTEICDVEAGGSALSKVIPICNRASKTIRVANRQRKENRQYRNYRKNYLKVGSDKNGNGIYKRKDKFWEMGAKAALHVAPNWLNFYMTKIGQDSMIDYNTRVGTFGTQFQQYYGLGPYADGLSAAHQHIILPPYNPVTFGGTNAQPMRFA